MHHLIAVFLIISIITIFFQCNNTKSAPNPNPTPSQQRGTTPTILSYSAKKEPFYGNWRLRQVSVGSAAPKNHPSKELLQRPNALGSAASPALTYSLYNKACPPYQGPGTQLSEESSWYAVRQLNTSSNTLNTSTTWYSYRFPTIIKAPPPPPAPNPSPTMSSSTMATRAAGRQRQIKKKQAKDMRAFQQMEQEHQQRLQEKKKHAKE